MAESCLSNVKKIKGRSRSHSKCNRRPESSSRQVKKSASGQHLNDRGEYEELKEKADEFERLLNTINGEEVISVNTLGLLINIQKTLAEKISVLFNSNNISVDENSVTVEFESNSKLKNKKRLSTSKSSLLSGKSNSLSLKDLEDNADYSDFLDRVTCFLCSEVLKNKIYLIKHLDENCNNKNVSSSSDNIPYSFFQILHKNTIKCNICPSSVFKNLNSYFIHMNSREHKLKAKIASCVKLHTDDLFCSTCKILVPNNYTQLTNHMTHLYHLQQQSTENLISDIIKQKFTGFLMNSKTLKCLPCSLPFSKKNNFEEYYDHLNKVKHMKNLKALDIDFDKIYCEKCKSAINISEIGDHLNSSEHEKKDKLWICDYCNQKFLEIKYLAQHMTKECAEIKNLRNQAPLLQNKKNINKVDKVNIESQIIPELCKPQKNEYNKSKRHILVKGQEDIRQVYLFFKKYGEVATANKLNKTTLVIEFYDENIVQKIMKIKKPIFIDGVNVEITDDFDPELNLDRAAANDNQISNESSDDNADDSKSNDEHNNENKKLMSNFYKLAELIIPPTFIKNNDKFEFQSVIQDCFIMKCKTCSIIGFQLCQLCGPEDEISLYCSLKEDGILKFFIMEEDIQSHIIQKNYELLKAERVWENVLLNAIPLPHVQCKHKITGKKFNIFFNESVEKLSTMFSKFVNGRENVRNFFMIIKYWFQFSNIKIIDFEFSIISLGIFFLSSHFNIPLPIPLQDVHIKISNLSKMGDSQQKKKNYEALAPFEVLDLLLRFLNFVLLFDFDKYAICLPLNYAVEKTVLSKLNCLKIKDLPSVCIFDTSLEYNFASKIQKEFKNLFIELSKTLSPIRKIMSLQSIFKFINYWYFRYLMVTELYMVEKWERHVINSIAFILFCLLWYFNAKYLLSGMSEAVTFVNKVEF